MSILVELPLSAYPAALDAKLNREDSYSFQVARALAWISQLAYETADSTKISTILSGWQLGCAEVFRGGLPLGDTRGFVVRGWGGVVIAFAGLDPLLAANWLTSFNILPGPDDISAGLQIAIDSVWSVVGPLIRDQCDTGLPIVLTGHSLGGALAIVAAHRLENEGLEVSAVYTFGSPRCGGTRLVMEYGDKLAAKTYRLVCGHDIIPSIPPSDLGFRHVGRFLTSAEDGTFSPAAEPEPEQSDKPQFIPTALSDLREILGSNTGPADREATQPGILGQLFRLLPVAIGDYIPSRYISALGFRLAGT